MSSETRLGSHSLAVDSPTLTGFCSSPRQVLSRRWRAEIARFTSGKGTEWKWNRLVSRYAKSLSAIKRTKVMNDESQERSTGWLSMQLWSWKLPRIGSKPEVDIWEFTSLFFAKFPHIPSPNFAHLTTKFNVSSSKNSKISFYWLVYSRSAEIKISSIEYSWAEFDWISRLSTAATHQSYQLVWDFEQVQLRASPSPSH